MVGPVLDPKGTYGIAVLEVEDQAVAEESYQRVGEKFASGARLKLRSTIPMFDAKAHNN